MKKFNQYIKESSSSLEVRESEFYVIMFEKSNMIPTGLIAEYKKSINTRNFNFFSNFGYRKYIDDFFSDDLKATENLDSLDTFELIELGFQSKKDVKKLYDFIIKKMEEFYNEFDNESVEKFKSDIEKWHGKIMMEKFIAIAQVSNATLNL